MNGFIGNGFINAEGPWPCQLMVEAEKIDVSTNLPRADKDWSFVDSNGHFHAYSQAAEGQHGRYPTLYTRIEEVSCGDPDHDADCDGANITHWLCVVCDEEVVPGKIDGPFIEYIDGPLIWSAKIQVPAERAFRLVNAHEKVILRVQSENGREAFGVGVVSGDYTFTSGDEYVALTVRDAGPLGERRMKRVPA